MDVEIIGETDGITDTRKVIIPIHEYNLLLSVAEAAKNWRELKIKKYGVHANTDTSLKYVKLKTSLLHELYEALDELECDT